MEGVEEGGEEMEIVEEWREGGAGQMSEEWREGEGGEGKMSEEWREGGEGMTSEFWREAGSRVWMGTDLVRDLGADMEVGEAPEVVPGHLEEKVLTKAEYISMRIRSLAQ